MEGSGSTVDNLVPWMLNFLHSPMICFGGFLDDIFYVETPMHPPPLGYLECRFQYLAVRGAFSAGRQVRGFCERWSSASIPNLTSSNGNLTPLPVIYHGHA